MRYEDASHAFQGQGPIANDDTDQVAAGAKSTATGNVISGEGTQTGAVGADSAAGAHITAIAGKGGEDTSFSGGKLSVMGEYGKLSVDAEGNYVYQANKGVENVRDRFTYTLADNNGASDTAALIIEIGKTPFAIKADAQQIVVGPDGVVTLPAGVELSDVHVVGRNLVIDMPDGTQLIIIDGAVFVPQLVLGGVEVPATNVAALLIGQEIAPAAGELPPSSGGNFAVPPPPLDPGVPLGDLIPPTEYGYTPPDVEEIGQILDEEPEAGSAFAQLDDDAQDDGNPGGVGDDPGTDIAEGTLPGSGGDGALTWDLLPDGSLPNGTFSFQDQGNGDVWILQNGIHVLTVSVDPLTGDYTVTQVAAIDHPAGNNENNLDFTINYTVTDEDGDVAIGTLTVNVDDDTPVAIEDPERVTGLVDEDDLPAGNNDVQDGDDDPGDADNDGDGTTTAGAAGSLLGLFSFGADQPGTLGLGTDTSGMTAQGLSSNGVALTYAVNGDTLTASAGGETIFTLTVHADGSWEFDLEGQLDHPIADTEDNLDIDFSSMIVGTDHDGDTASLPDDTFVITVDDDLPVPVGEREQVTGLVDEDDLPSGNNDVQDGDDDPGNDDNDDDGTTTGGDEGSLTGLFSFGADQPGTVELSSDTSELPALTSNGHTVSYSVNGNVLTATANGSTVFTLTVNPDGSWVFDLEGQLDHSIPGTEDNLFLDFSSIIIGVDADGDTATLPPESFVVNVDDDMPQEFEECPDDVITVNDPDADTFTGNLNLPPVGADEPGVVTFGVEDGDPVLDNSDNPITSGGVPLFYFINEDGVLEARAGDENGEVIFTITLNGDGTFTYDQLGVIGEGGEFTFDDLTSTSAGNVEFRGVGADDPATTVDLLLSADDNGTDTSVNTDSDSIGSANQSMDDGETVRIDFVTNLTTGAATPSQFGYGDHVSSSSFLGVIPQVQGNQDETVAFTVWALDTSNTQASEPDRDPTGGFSDSTITTITEVTVKDYLTGETHTEAVAFTDGTTFEALDFGISVRVNADGSVTFSGIQQGDSYGFSTGAGEFNAVAVQADPAGTGGSTEDSFDLGVFSIGTTTEFEPVDLTVPIVLTDADGDPVVCDIDIHIGPPLDVDDITVTVNEAGLDLVGSDPGSNSETQGGDLQGQVSGGTGPYTFALAPGESADGLYGTLTLNPDGTFSYTLDTPYDTQPDADDGTNPELGKDSFDVIATDSEGATQTLTIFVNIIDDVPSIDVTADDDSEVELLTQDAQTIGGLSDTDSSSADFSGVFGFTAVEGADGASVTPDLDYELGISAPGADSGLEQGGDPIYLYVIGGKVVGSTSAVEGDVDASNTVFDVAVSATGVVTLTQYSQIDHPLEGGLNDAPFEDQIIALADELVTLTASATIVDNDGDTDQDSETVNIGANLQFADHGPIANNDVDSVVGGFDPATGNVLTGTEVGVVEDTNGTDGVADNVGADTPGRITNIDHDASPAEVVPDGGSVSIQGNYGVLTIYSNGDYSYQRDPGTPGGVEDVFTYTLTDYDGDTDTATLTIGIDDNFPTLPDPDQILLDDDVIPAANGNNDGPGDDNPDAPDDNVVAGQLNGSGGDAPLTYNFTNDHTLPTGFSIDPASDDNTLIIVQDQGGSDVTVMTIELDQSDGSFTVTQNNPILHDPTNPGAGAGQEDNFEDNLNFSIGVEVEDNDGDVEPAHITINVDDDTPTINVTKGDDSGVTLTTDDAQTIGGASDTAVSTANFSGVFGLTQSAGADGAAAAATLQYTLDVTGYTGGPAGVNSGLESGDADIFLYEIGGKVVGSTSATLAGVDGTNTVFDVQVAADGVVTLTQYSQIDHDTVDPTPGGSPFADHIVSLSDSLVTLTASATLTDNDGDTVTDSEVANIGANLRFTDDGPDVAATLTGTQIRIDETDGVTAAGGEVDPVGGNLGTVTMTLASLVNVTNPHTSADAPTSYSYSFALSSQGVDSGLDVSSNNASIFLYSIGGVVYGSTAASAAAVDTATLTNVAFTFTIDSGTGAVTLTQYKAVEHLNTANNDEDSSGIAAGALSLVVTATDFDGDTDTASVDLGSVVRFEDDGPTLGIIQDGTASNDPTDPVTVGTLHFAVGSDTPADVTSITTGSLAGITSGGKGLVTNFDNATNTLTAYQDANGNGIYDAGTDNVAVFTLAVDPAAGTSGQYTFDLLQPLDPTVTDTPIGGSSSFGAGPTLGQILEDAVGNDLSVISGYHPTGSFNPATWLSTGVLATTMVTSAGVNGSTSGWGVDNNNFENPDELIIFDFGAGALGDFDGDPAPPGPDAADYTPPATTLPNISFATFEFIGYKSGAGDAGDDIAFVVHYTDGTFASGFIPAANIDGALWTHTAPAGKFIADIQFFSGMEPSGAVQDLAPGKIDLVSVGVQTSDLDETIDFNVTITDADGDPVSGGFSVNIADGNSASTPEALLAPEPESFSSLSSFSLLADDGGDQQLQKTAANSNTLTMAAAVAAAGMAESAAATPPADSSLSDGSEEQAFTSQMVDMKLVDGGNDGGSSVAGLPETQEADAAPGNSGGHSRAAENRSGESLDASSHQQAADASANQAANDDQGPAAASAAAGPIAPTVAMVSAEALQAANLDGGAKHGAVEEIVAEALGHGNAPATVDALLNAIHGGNAGDAAIADLASTAGSGVPAWDMAMHGASAASLDMMMKMGAEMLHHDMVQPTHNG